MPPTHRCATVLAVPSYLLRIKLVDRPGSLGALAVILSGVGIHNANSKHATDKSLRPKWPSMKRRKRGGKRISAVVMNPNHQSAAALILETKAI